MTTTPEPAELLPCNDALFSIKPLKLEQSSRTNNLYCKTEVGFYEVDKDGFIYSPYIRKCPDFNTAIADLNKDYMQKVMSLLDTRTPPAPVADDAVEAFVQVLCGDDFEGTVGDTYAVDFIGKLRAKGYHLRRETMTEAELEREADELVTMAFTGSIGIGDWKAATKALAKKYRG